MAQQTPGRHRRLPKHRAATVNNGRAAVVAATLFAGLAAGAGTATASPTHHVVAGDDPGFTGAGGISIVGTDPVTRPAIAADAAAKKDRVVVHVEKTAAWVDPNPTAVVTSCFGERWGRLHAGVDLAAPEGTPILAAGAGVVVRAGVAEGYGNAILIDHGNGYLTHYGHLSVIGVTVGQHVAAGQQIGNEGSTGHSTGPHLHFEVHQGYYKNPIEPTAWMRAHGVDIPGCS